MTRHHDEGITERQGGRRQLVAARAVLVDAGLPRLRLIHGGVIRPTHTNSFTHHEGRAKAARAGGEVVRDSAKPLLLVVVVDERLATPPLGLHLRPELSLPGTIDKGDWRAPTNRTTERVGV